MPNSSTRLVREVWSLVIMVRVDTIKHWSPHNSDTFPRFRYKVCHSVSHISGSDVFHHIDYGFTKPERHF